MLAYAALAAARADQVKGALSPHRHGHDRTDSTRDPQTDRDPPAPHPPRRPRLGLVRLAPTPPTPGPTLPLQAARTQPNAVAVLTGLCPSPTSMFLWSG